MATTADLFAFGWALLAAGMCSVLVSSVAGYSDLGLQGQSLQLFFLLAGSFFCATLAWKSFRRAEDPLTRTVGIRPPFPHGPISSEGVDHARMFRPRSSDVFILTPPKTGTTWMQMLCHCLRTQGRVLEFEDIYQVVPWDQLAWDLGQNLSDEQVAFPRLFKTHLRISSINRGAKYICLVRRVEDVAVSWWNFLRPKDIPPLRQYGTVSQFVFDEGFFAGGMRFGATIWEYYVEFYQALRLPEVLVLCYEDLVADLPMHLHVIAKFMDLPKGALGDSAVLDRIVDLCSKQGMANMMSKFDETWTYKELQRVGRMQDPSSFTPSPKVKVDSNYGSDSILDEHALEFLNDRWRTDVSSKVGLQDYAALQEAVRAEIARRRELS